MESADHGIRKPKYRTRQQREARKKVLRECLDDLREGVLQFQKTITEAHESYLRGMDDCLRTMKHFDQVHRVHKDVLANHVSQFNCDLEAVKKSLIRERISNEGQAEDGDIGQRGNHDEPDAQTKHDIVSGTVVPLRHNHETNANESNETKQGRCSEAS